MPEAPLPESRRPRPGVASSPYGSTRDGTPVREFVLARERGIVLRVLEYGGILRTLEAPDRDGKLTNVVLGRPSLQAYEAASPYLGAIVGRYGNRIAGATFELDGTRYTLAANQAPNHLHGGAKGFDKRVWRGEPSEGGGDPTLTLRYTSPAGEEGYPGTLDVTATYALVDDATVRLSFHAVTDAPTVVNLTGHSYFNLAGEGSGTICDHRLTVDADRFVPVDDALIPTGELAPVTGTPFDLRSGVVLRDAIRADHPQIARAKGIDHTFVLTDTEDAGVRRTGELRRAAQLVHPRSGRVLEVHTVEPGLQVYTGNMLDGTLVGTGGRRYRQGDGIALETQVFPDAPNQPSFPSAVLRPGDVYETVTELRFGVEG